MSGTDGWSADPAGMVTAGEQLEENASAMDLAAAALDGLARRVLRGPVGATIAGAAGAFEDAWQTAFDAIGADVRALSVYVSGSAAAVQFVDVEALQVLDMAGAGVG